MAKAIQNNFSGGWADDIREPTATKVHVAENFDLFSNPRKASPLSTTTDDTGAGAKQIIKMTNTEGTIAFAYGLGIVDGSNRTKIFGKATATAAWADTSIASVQATGGTSRDTTMMVLYKDKLYGTQRDGGGTHFVWEGNVSENSFTDEYSGSSGIGATGQGIVHSHDDVLYIPDGDGISTLNNTTIGKDTLSLPSNMSAVSIAQYFNFLAVGMTPLNTNEDMHVFLWDRVNTDVTETINLGPGTLLWVAEAEGSLFVASIQTTSYTANSAGEDKLVIGKYVGRGEFETVFEIINEGGHSGSKFGNQVWKEGEKIYFAGGTTRSGVRRDGLWVIGRRTPKEPFGITMEMFDDNGTLNPNPIDNRMIFKKSGRWYLKNQEPSSISEVTYSTNLFTSGTSIIETVVNPAMAAQDRFEHKEFRTFSINHTPLSIDGTIVVKYQKDENIGTTTWSTFLTSDVQNDIKKDADPEIGDFREVRFRIESTEEGEPIGFEYTYEVTGR